MTSNRKKNPDRAGSNKGIIARIEALARRITWRTILILVALEAVAGIMFVIAPLSRFTNGRLDVKILISCDGFKQTLSYDLLGPGAGSGGGAPKGKRP